LRLKKLSELSKISGFLRRKGCFVKGFNFEDTHITKLDRIEKLLALLIIAFCWAYKTGEWRNEQKEIKIKKHGRKARSYFRYGLDILRDLVLNDSASMVHIGKTVRDLLFRIVSMLIKMVSSSH